MKNLSMICAGLRTFAAACVLGLNAHATASTPSPANKPAIAIEGGQWFDGTRFVREDWFVVNGKFTRRRPARIDVKIDAEGRYVVPPYADAHNHNMQNAWGIGRNLVATLKNGVFYSAQLCAQPDDIKAFRSILGQPTTPDVLFATACMSATDGHPLSLLIGSAKEEAGNKEPDLALLRKMYVAIDTEDELAARWNDILESKPDFIKVILIDSERHASRFRRPELLGANGLDPKLLSGIVRRAHAAGVRVVAHTDAASDVKAAAQAGVDILAHLPGYRFERGIQPADYRIDDETIALLAKRKIPVIATASVTTLLHRPDSKVLEDVKAMQKENLTRLIKAGVPLLIGSDNVMAGPLTEVEYLDALGILPREKLLALLTGDTPRTMYPNRAIGRFEEGSEGSFLLLDGNPLHDLSALHKIALRVKQGNILTLP